MKFPKKCQLHTVIFYSTYTVDLENFQPLARFKVQKFAEVTKFVLGFKQFKCDSSALQTAAEVGVSIIKEPMNFLDARQSVLIYLLTTSWTLW